MREVDPRLLRHPSSTTTIAEVDDAVVVKGGEVDDESWVGYNRNTASTGIGHKQPLTVS